MKINIVIYFCAINISFYTDYLREFFVLFNGIE